MRARAAEAPSLRRGLIDLAEEYHHTSRRPPSIDIGAGLDAMVPDDVVPDVLNIVREAVSNAMRHAQATPVHICARADKGESIVHVRDARPGFDAEAVSLGHGLVNMAERAAILGAVLTVNSRPSQGTSVALRVPLSTKGRDVT